VNHLSEGNLYTYDYGPWLEALETYRNSPAMGLQSRVKSTEKLVLSIQYMSAIDVSITIKDANEEVLHSEVFHSKYYTRLLGTKHTIIQGKTLILPVSEWGLGDITVHIEHPFGKVTKTVTLAP